MFEIARDTARCWGCSGNTYAVRGPRAVPRLASFKHTHLASYGFNCARAPAAQRHAAAEIPRATTINVHVRHNTEVLPSVLPATTEQSERAHLSQNAPSHAPQNAGGRRARLETAPRVMHSTASTPCYEPLNAYARHASCVVMSTSWPCCSSMLSLPGPCTTRSSSAPTVDIVWKKK